jgi:prepilin-type N-terminal cleavage/methylation domain-containing protein
MTSGTGKPAALGGGRSPRRGGFTLIEILVVMAILMSLAALVLVVVGPAQNRAKKTRTQALLRRLGMELDEYRRLTGSFPPDGIDSPVRNDKGELIRGSACLYYFLAKPVAEVKFVGGVRRTVEHPPLDLFSEAELGPDDPDHPGVREIIDGYGVPMHYDNTEDGVFRAQKGDVHYPPLEEDEHPLDPRTLSEKDGGVPRPNTVQSASADTWSHGERGHNLEGDPSPPLASWNLRE